MGERRVQQVVWRTMARATIAVGMVCTVAHWGLRGPAVITLGLSFPAFVVALLVGRSVGRSIGVGLTLAFVVVSSVGVIVVSGWSGAALLVVVVALAFPLNRLPVSPAGMAAALRLVRYRDTQPSDETTWAPEDPGPVSGARDRGSSLPPTAEIPSADGLPALDDRALCQAWRRSFVHLETSRAPATRLEVVGLRQLYLDELIRRHPAEVRHWLDSGARAAGNPLPFLQRPVVEKRPAADTGPATND